MFKASLDPTVQGHLAIPTHLPVLPPSTPSLEGTRHWPVSLGWGTAEERPGKLRRGTLFSLRAVGGQPEQAYAGEERFEHTKFGVFILLDWNF